MSAEAMNKVHFGARLDPGVGRYATIVEHAKLAERGGYDSIWVNDHIGVPELVGTEDWLECFTTVAGLTRETSTVQIGTLVTSTPWRNPALVAKMGATLDDMSGGRFILGLGAGGGEREFRRYGWHHAPRADRARMAGEAADLIRTMWTEYAPSYRGRYFETDEALCEPRPAAPPKIMIGASGDRFGLPMAARYADIWNIGSGDGIIESYRKKVEHIDRLCEENGRDPATLSRAVNLYLIVDQHDRALERLDRMLAFRKRMGNLREIAIAGDAEAIAERIRPYQALGATWFIPYFWEPDAAAQADNIERFAREVIPLFR